MAHYNKEKLLTKNFKSGAINTEVQHIIYLYETNATNTEISLNQKNLVLLSNEGHKKESVDLKAKVNLVLIRLKTLLNK